MTFIPSQEQAAIFKAVLESGDNIAISALAGTGKTTTLVELARLLPASGSKIFCAFNKDIVSELERRLKGTGMRAQTFHGLGFSALKKHLGVAQMTPNGRKYREIVQAWTEDNADLSAAISEAVASVQDGEQRAKLAKEYLRETVNMAVDTLNFLRLKLVDPRDTASVQALIWENRFDDGVNFDEDITRLVVDAIPTLMATAEKAVREQMSIDFTDMIYWPVRWDVQMYQHNWVFTDEIQDISPMQRRLIEKLVWPRGGRFVGVGDPWQSIYSFAGADSDSFDLTVETFHTRVMPLTVTRRCAAIITQHAANLVPDFRCLPDKPRGKIVWIDESRIDALKAGDMVLCRVKAPLVGLILELLAAGKAATILGAEIGERLIAILEKLQKRQGYTWETLLDSLAGYEAEQVEKYLKRNDEPMAEAMKDQCAALRILVEDAKAANYEALVYHIQSLFSAKLNADLIVLATIHKSKGLEAERIFILKPEKLPLLWADMSEEAAQQEDNLDYVARTRAKSVLVYLTNKKYLENTHMPPYAQADFEDREWPEQIALPEPERVETVLIEEAVASRQDKPSLILDTLRSISLGEPMYDFGAWWKAVALAVRVENEAAKQWNERGAARRDDRRQMTNRYFTWQWRESPPFEPDGACPYMIENQRGAPPGEDWLTWGKVETRPTPVTPSMTVKEAWQLWLSLSPTGIGWLEELAVGKPITRYNGATRDSLAGKGLVRILDARTYQMELTEKARELLRIIDLSTRAVEKPPQVSFHPVEWPKPNGFRATGNLAHDLAIVKVQARISQLEVALRTIQDGAENGRMTKVEIAETARGALCVEEMEHAL